VLGETAEERRAHGARVGHGCPSAEHAKARERGRRLGEDCTRPGDRGTAQQCEAGASCHGTRVPGITSAVPVRSASGMGRPRAEAVSRDAGKQRAFFFARSRVVSGDLKL